MIFILPFSFMLFFLIRYDLVKNSLRAFIDSCVIFSTLTVFTAEFLSIFNAYNALFVFSVWTAISAGCFIIFRNNIISSVSHIGRYLKECLYNRKNNRIKNSGFGKPVYAFVTAVVLFIAGTLLIALIIPSVAYDSHTYHLPRVFYWYKNNSVHNFASDDGRQLYAGPFNAFTMLQTAVLTGGRDRLFGMSHWFSYAGTIAASALIAAQLGLSRRWQIISALLTASIPLSILQAGTTQNDLMTAFWCAVSVYYVLLLITDRETEQWFHTGLFLGFSVGTALLTKTSAAPALLPFAVMMVCCKLRKETFKRLIYTAGVILCCISLICAGFYIRNAIDLDGDFLAVNVPIMSAVTAADMPPGHRIALTVMNLSYNLRCPPVNRAIATVAGWLGADINDERLLFNDFLTSDFSLFSHDSAPNHLHFILCTVAVFLLVVLYLKYKNRRDPGIGIIIAYAGACMASFCIVAASFRFQPSASRFLLTPLILSMPFCAAALSSIRDCRIRRFAGLITASAAFINGIVIMAAGAIYPVYGYVSENAVPDRLEMSPANRVAATLTALPGMLPEAMGNLEDSRLYGTLGNNMGPVLNNMTKAITDYEITRIGILGFSPSTGGLASYPVLNTLWDDRLDVSQINCLYNRPDSFMPQAIITHMNSSGISQIAQDGITYLPVLYEKISNREVSLVLLIDEAIVS